MNNLRNAIAMALLTIATSHATAENITCTFTEPFVDLVFNSSTQVLVESEHYSRPTALAHVERSREKGMPSTTSYLKTSDGKLVATLELDFQGSNGMSDAIFPYSVTYYGFSGSVVGDFLSDGSYTGDKLIGGCVSDLYPMVRDE